MLRNVIGFAVLATIVFHGCGSDDPALMDTCSPSHVPSAGTCKECSFQGTTFVLCNNTYVLCMPIRLPQNGALGYDPVHVKLPPDTIRVSETLP